MKKFTYSILLVCGLSCLLFPLVARGRVIVQGPGGKAVIEKPVKGAIKTHEDSGGLKKKYKVSLGADETEVGDLSSAEFKPQAKIKRWGQEAYLNITLPETGIPENEKSVNLQGDKVSWVSSKIGADFYKKDLREIKTQGKKDFKEHTFVLNENGGFEFEIILREKPVSNVISLSIETKGLKFYYQAPLTQSEIDKGIVRPDEVAGSYAVYHESKKDGEYKTGKAFHIYRPKIIDKDGEWTWGDLVIASEAKQSYLKITIDHDWLETAAYPVTVDPEFGYTSIGLSAIPLDNIIRGSIFTASAFTPSSITAYLENIDLAASHTAKYAIYKVGSSNLFGQTEEVTVPAGEKGWYEGLYTTSFGLTAEEYGLAANSGSSNILIYFDTGAAQQGFYKDKNYVDAWPGTTAGFVYDDKIYSIWDAATQDISITVTLDATPPGVPVAANITVTQNPSPAQDQVTGAIGAVEGLSTVKIYKESGLTTFLGSAVAVADGSFSAIDIGDNQATGNLIYITATDAVGNASTWTSKGNDITAPTPDPSTGLSAANVVYQITWTINAATDSGIGLHATPYSFDNGISWASVNVLTESSLIANTQYSKQIKARDAAGNTTTAGTLTCYTLSLSPVVTCNQSVGWTNSGSFIFTNGLVTWGDGTAASYGYVWTTNASYAWNEADKTVWNSGTITPAFSSGNQYYLYVHAYNGDSVDNGTELKLGPYGYEATAPTVSWFTL